MQISPDQLLYIRGGLGRLHRVTAIFTDPTSANAYLSSSPTESVLAVFDPLIFIATSADLGLPFPLPTQISHRIRALVESARIFLAEGDVATNRVEADDRLFEVLAALHASSPSARELLARLRDVDAEYNHEISKIDLDWTLADAKAVALLASWQMGGYITSKSLDCSLLPSLSRPPPCSY